VGAELARLDLAQSQLRERGEVWTAQLEREMDQHTEQLPPLANFILPGGGPAAAAIHLARSVCRRAERIFFAEPVPDGQWIGVYLNRLGDWLFVLARLVNQADHQREAIWIAGVD
jgi:cob(I)alamin adenosyltransferase